MNICVVGTGYVGLSSGTCLAYLGHQVRGFDVDPKRAASLREGVLPIYEPRLDELFRLSRNNLTFGGDLALAMKDADAIFVTVGTPSLPDGSPDLQYIDSAAEMTGRISPPNPLSSSTSRPFRSAQIGEWNRLSAKHTGKTIERRTRVL